MAIQTSCSDGNRNQPVSSIRILGHSRGRDAGWGLLGQLRIDNGMPWGSQGDLPTDLACGLAGLGLGLVINPPRRPQNNGVIERYQGHARRHLYPGTGTSIGR